MVLDVALADGLLQESVTPRLSYADTDSRVLLTDWEVLATFFNRVNRSMGQRDLYPFQVTESVATKLGYVHDLVTARP